MSRWKPDAAGRLLEAAITLFAAQGYDTTTVTNIAEEAGLTRRTFFRYYSDKREVLFGGSEQLERVWLESIDSAPAEASPLSIVAAGFDSVAEMFLGLHSFARIRSEIIEANTELRERELIKLQSLAESLKSALVHRGCPPGTAILAAQTGVTIFHIAFTNWVHEEDPMNLRQLMEDSLKELRALTHE